MPNYNLYVGRSRYYDPTEFQTLREDLKNMTDQYNTTMAAYGEMSSKADLFEKLANDVKGKDSVAYQNYMNYANAIRQHTDLLATQGITPSTMRNLVQAKNDYNRIIAPIEEAYNAREAEAKRQAEYMSKYPGAIFERDANKMGIDQWMKNPSYRAKSLDRETVANRAKERFAALQKKIQEFVSEHGHVDPSTMDANQLKQWVKTNIPYEYQALEKYGVSPDDVRELMLGNPRMQNSILQAIVNDTMGMYGVDTWNTDYDHYTDAQNQQNRFNIYNQVYNTIRGEAPNSVGLDKYDNKTDNITWQRELDWARLAEQKRHNMAIEALSKEKNQGSGGGGGDDDDPKKVYTFYNTQDETNVDENIETTKADNLRMLSDLITYEPRLDEYDYDDLMKEFKKVYGDGAADMIQTMKERPELAKDVASRLFESFGKDGILLKGRQKGAEYNMPLSSLGNNKFYDVFNGVEEDNGDITVNNNDYSKLTNGQLLKVYNTVKKEIQDDVQKKYYRGGNTSGRIADIEKLANPSDYGVYKSVVDEILERKKNGKLNSRIKQQLKDLINYDENSDLSLSGATDDYIGDAALTTTTSRTNYQNQSAKVFMDTFAEILRQNPDNTGVSVDGKDQDLDDLSNVLSKNDAGEYKYTPQFYLKPVKDKNGKWSHKFGFSDQNGKWYDVKPDLFGGPTKNARRTALANMDDYLNKMYNYKLTEKDKKLVDEATDNYFKEVGIEHPTQAQRESIRDMYVRQIKQQVREMYEHSYEENRANYWSHLFNETHLTNFMGTNTEQNTNTVAVDPAYNYGQTGK